MGYYYFIHRCGFSRPDPKALQGFADKEQKQTARESEKIFNKKRSILIFFIISVMFR